MERATTKVKDADGQPLALLEAVETFGDENTVDEPEISGGTKKMNKQNVGALPFGIKIMGHVSVRPVEDIMSPGTFMNPGLEFLTGLWELFNLKQITFPSYPYGRIGFRSNVNPFFDVFPNSSEGYSMKPPSIKWAAPEQVASFEIMLLYGGDDWLTRFTRGPP